jgi:hypothetical protein
MNFFKKKQSDNNKNEDGTTKDFSKLENRKNFIMMTNGICPACKKEVTTKGFYEGADVGMPETGSAKIVMPA